MDKQNEKRSQQEEPQPGSLSSFNNRQGNRQGQVEETIGEKEESNSDQDDDKAKEE